MFLRDQYNRSPQYSGSLVSPTLLEFLRIRERSVLPTTDFLSILGRLVLLAITADIIEYPRYSCEIGSADTGSP